MFKSARKSTSSVRVFGALEKEVMNIVWQNKTSTVRDVHERIERRRSVAYTTIMTIMDRLFVKRILKRKKEGKTYQYTPYQNKDNFFRRASQKIVNALVEEFGEVAIAQFVSQLDKVDENKLKALRRRLKSKN